MTKTIIYTRGDDLKDTQKQRETLIEFAKSKKFEIVGYFSDNDKQKKSLKNAFSLLDTLEKGQILVTQTDKITIDTKELAELKNKYKFITP